MLSRAPQVFAIIYFLLLITETFLTFVFDKVWAEEMAKAKVEERAKKLGKALGKADGPPPAAGPLLSL